jgi:hypothetical protein
MLEKSCEVIFNKPYHFQSKLLASMGFSLVILAVFHNLATLELREFVAGVFVVWEVVKKLLNLINFR